MSAEGVEDAVAAVIDGVPLGADEVDARLAVLRATPRGARLPAPATAEGRNARRWVVQFLCAQRIVERELAARGIASTAVRPLHLLGAIGMGGVAAAVLAEIPGAVQLLEQFVEPVAEAELSDYYRRNLDQYDDGAVPFEQARSAIATELGAAHAESAFALWLERAMQQRVRLSPGFEHPATPSSPDATHRH